jgi:Lower baseplate protein N-terminal domain
MAIDFPNTPTNGDTFTVGSVTWIYVSATTSWNVNSSAAFALDADVVHKAGTETITGVKTFTANPAIQSTSGIPSLDITSIQAGGYAPAFLNLARQGVASAATPDAQGIGEIRFSGLTTTSAYFAGASINANSYVNTATGAPTDLAFYTHSGTSLLERMRIDSKGAVTMLGSSTSGSNNAALKVQDTTGTGAPLILYASSGTAATDIRWRFWDGVLDFFSNYNAPKLNFETYHSNQFDGSIYWTRGRGTIASPANLIVDDYIFDINLLGRWNGAETTAAFLSFQYSGDAPTNNDSAQQTTLAQVGLSMSLRHSDWGNNEMLRINSEADVQLGVPSGGYFKNAWTDARAKFTLIGGDGIWAVRTITASIATDVLTVTVAPAGGNLIRRGMRLFSSTPGLIPPGVYITTFGTGTGGTGTYNLSTNIGTVASQTLLLSSRPMHNPTLRLRNVSDTAAGYLNGAVEFWNDSTAGDGTGTKGFIASEMLGTGSAALVFGTASTTQNAVEKFRITSTEVFLRNLSVGLTIENGKLYTSGTNGGLYTVADNGSGSNSLVEQTTGTVRLKSTASGSYSELSLSGNSATLTTTGGGTFFIASAAMDLAGIADTATTASHYFVEVASNGDIQPKTLANVKTEIVTTAAVNSAAATTVGTVTSGIWNAGQVTSSAQITAQTATSYAQLGIDSGGSLTVGRQDSVSSSPYIDFNSGATTVDFDSRISASGGTGSSGGGTLTITAGSLSISGAAAGTITVGNGLTSGTINLGGAAVTSAGSVNILSAGTTSGTKTINIGTSGSTGSTTTINIGTAGGTTPTTNFFGPTIFNTSLSLSGVADTATAATHYFVETGSDGLIRPKTLANVRTEVVTGAAITSGGGATDSLVVHLAGTETITGAKTFQSTTLIGIGTSQTIQLIPGTGGGGIEIGRTDNVASTPFIDFHSGTTGANDFDARIIASGGTASAGNGTLTLTAATVSHSGLTTLGNDTTQSAGNFIMNGGAIRISANTGGLLLWGGVSSEGGASLELYGSTHGSQANRAILDTDYFWVRSRDTFTTKLIFDSTAAFSVPITSTGTISATGLAGSLLSSANPLADGTAGPGTSAIPSRQDHIHPGSSGGASWNEIFMLMGA